ncbi:RIP metalloprotease RseP [bacterium]|nr:RIP metalloprotease RseP [bacterium]
MLLTLVSFIVVLGVVVFVHEFGHFAAAKLSGARVEAFSIGFGKLFGIKRGETEYRLGYIPLGGYVKISGMVDEFMDEEGGIKGEPWEFQSKSTLAKVFMISAGVIMNFILGFVIYTGITLFEGKPTTDPSALIGSVAEDYPAMEAGVQPGDRILAVDGVEASTWLAFRDLIRERANQETQLRWVSGVDTMSATVIPREEQIVEDEQLLSVGMIGVGPRVIYQPAGIGTAIVTGAQSTWNILDLSLQSVGMLVKGEASVSDLTGPAGIVYLSGETARAGWISFVSFIAFISISIGFLNILPFPVLDGGHLVYILIEAIIRRPVSTKVKLVLQQVGMALLLLLVLVVTYHDILRFFVG